MREPVVDSVMTRQVVTVGIDTPFKELVETLQANRFSAVPVIDDVGLVAGVVSEADLLAKEEFRGGAEPSPSLLAGKDAKRRWRKAHGVVAAEVMTRPVITIGPDAPASAAAHRLADANVRRLFVVDDKDELVGVVTRSDLLKLFLRTDESLRADIEQQVFGRVFWIAPPAVEVEVELGTVVLRGDLERRSDAELAAYLARTLPGVVDVFSELTYRFDDTTTGSPTMPVRHGEHF